MSYVSRLAAPLVLTPLLASCVFLLDYDELEGGKPPNAAGGSSAGGPVTQAGSAGEAAGCGNCDDSDPCTVDACDDAGETPQCTHTVQPGLALDGVDETLRADKYHRVSLVAGAQVFYLAAFATDAGVADVTLYRLDGSDERGLETLDKISDLRLDGTVLSNVGLTVDSAAGGLALHGFVAVKPRLAGSEPRVFHLVNRNGKTTSNIIPGSTYLKDSPSRFPQALTIGSKVVGAWIEADGTIAVHDAGADVTTQLGDPTTPATTLSLIATADDRPAVFYTAQDTTTLLGTFVQMPGTKPSPVMECQSSPGIYLSSNVISSQLPGIWLGQVTRAGDDYLTTTTSTLLCTGSVCKAIDQKCDPTDLSNGARNPSGSTAHLDGTPAGLVHSVVAVPQVGLGPNQASVVATLTLGMSQVDFSDQGATESVDVGAPFTVASQATGEAVGFTGPDWPAVGILPSGRAAVAWIEPSEDRESATLRVQRYRMCLPED